MSIYPQGIFQYTGGIDDSVPILGGWEVTLVHGLAPSVFNISIPMVQGIGPPQKNGDVILRYGDVVITLKDCTIDKCTQDVGGALIWNLSILDRRWRWRFRAVSGRWNVRWKNGTDVREETQATPSELAAICLDAMGETSYDVDALKAFDGTDWPETDWTVENAAEALQTLCERYECRAVYDWQEDRVVVVVVGKGAALDLTIPYTQVSGTFDPPEKPGKLVLLCGPSSVQYDLQLEPVGLDVDAKIKYLDQLSYAPEKPSTDALQPELGNDAFQYDRWLPWEGSDRGFFNIGVPYLRQYAIDTVLKWYRVVPPKKMDGLEVIAGDRTDIEGLDDFGSIAEDADRSWLWRIELQGEQNDRLTTLADPLATQFDEYNKEVSQTPLQAWVYGNFQSALLNANVLRDDFGLDENQDPVLVPFSGLKKLNPALIFSPAQQQASTLPNQDVPAQLQAKVEETGFYTGGFSIDPERGIVKFSEQVVQVAPPKNAQIIWRNSKGEPLPDDLSCVIFPASLWLRTRFFVRDQKRALVRYQKTRVLDPESSTVRYIIRDDLTLKLTYRFDTTDKAIDVSQYPPTLEPSGTETNQDVIDKACDAYLDQIEDEYETRQPQTVVYPGFLPLTLDGAIRQVTWFVDFQGFAYTRVSRDQEELHMVRDYADRRLAERLKAMADRERANRDPKAQLAAEAERKWGADNGESDLMAMPKYKHLVWNRTDLTVSNQNLQVTYGGAKPPLIEKVWPPANYAGETIPPYAAMRIISNPILHKNEICWMVSRPDDESMAHQSVGLHFFNGPYPIPVQQYGYGTNELPAPVLIDLTVDSPALPYGNANGPVSGPQSAADTGWLMGFASGSWALHPSGDLISYGSDTWVAIDTGVANGIATMLATQFPYVIMGRDPVDLSGKEAGPSASPEVAFLYSNNVFWVGRGALAFGSTAISG